MFPRLVTEIQAINLISAKPMDRIRARRPELRNDFVGGDLRLSLYCPRPGPERVQLPG